MTDVPDCRALADQDGLPVEELVRTFSDPVARYAVSYLASVESASLDELADVVTGWANAESDGVASATDRDRLRLELYHVYLPKLADLDVVAFDPDDRTATIVAPSDTTEGLLRCVRNAGLEHLDDGQG